MSDELRIVGFDELERLWRDDERNAYRQSDLEALLWDVDLSDLKLESPDLSNLFSNSELSDMLQ